MKQTSHLDFVCPDGANYNLLFGFGRNGNRTFNIQPSLQGEINILENSQSILQYTFTTEYCNWLDSKLLKSVVVRPDQNHHFHNLDQYLTPGKRYALELNLPNNEQEISLWIHFEKKVKVAK